MLHPSAGHRGSTPPGRNSTRSSARAATSRGLGLLVALVLGVTLAACGSDDTPDGSTAPGGETTAGTFPVTVEHKLGSVEIASEPKRVVALSPQDADISTALGVVPVAAVEYFNSKTALSPWLAPKVGSKKIDILPDPSSQGSVSFEKLAALTPDLILAGNLFTLERDYDKLVRIAPVVAFQEGPLEDGWQEKTQLAGRALGREQQAREVVTKLEGRFDELRRDHPEFANKTFSFSVQLAPGGVETITSTKDYAVQLMTQLGLRLTPTVASLKNATETSSEGNVSLEELRVLDADVMVMAFATDGLRKQLERSRVFQRIPAVRRGDYVPLTLDAIAALRGPSVLSIPYGLDALVPGLTRSLDG